MKIKVSNVNTPNWKEVTVKSRIPVELERLSEIARNIWWAWNFEATELFRDLDPELWKECGQNPVLLLERMSYEKLEALAKDKVILRRMNDVYTKFRDYMDVKSDEKRPSVAYFSMEYGLSSVLKIYSGGLGVLAGDYLKEASDSNVDLCAVGFLYRYGYFTQTLSMDGQQIANYEAQNFGQLPIERVMDANGQPLIVDVPYLDYFVHANVWRVNVGRISLYLLDTDNEMNSEFDRPITHQLYGGDWENRLKQEILLGIGGILTLKALGIKKDVYHCNEGHAALINVQRICDYVATGLTFDQAIELVRASSLYTVHTPVPAGHDYFDEGLFGKYMGGYPSRMGITWDDLMDLGRNNPGDKGERFCMSVFACNTSQEVNGVSWLHGKVSQEMFSSIWKGYFPEESHVGYVTNGVHFPTWSATEWKELYLEAKSNMENCKNRCTGILIEVAAQHPLMPDGSPGVEFKARLNVAIKLYQKFIAEGKTVHIYIPGSIHFFRGHADPISLSMSGKNYLISQQIPESCILGEEQNIKYKGNLGVYNSADECFVASKIFFNGNYSKIYCVCSPNQITRKQLFYIAFGIVPMIITVPCDELMHDPIYEIFEAVPNVIMHDHTWQGANSIQGQRTRKERNPELQQPPIYET